MNRSRTTPSQIQDARTDQASAARWPPWAAGLVGCAWYLWIGGASTINPGNTSWISGDWQQHWLGFLYFLREPWTFPVGTLSRIPYPLGTSIGFTDSNPLLAVPAKLFAGVLPAEFQVIGPWLFLCFALQGYFGALLCRAVTRNPAHQFLGGCLFALSPVLTNRIGHDTLCAQWIVLGLLYLGLRHWDDAAQARRGAYAAAGLTLLAATIHPYLTAMSLVLATASHVRLVLERLLRPIQAVLIVLVMVIGCGAIMAAIGYFGDETRTLGGFGIFSADLLSLFDPRTTSRLLPELPTTPAQWEGFAFLGVGGLALVSVAAVIAVRQRVRLSSHRWVVIAAVLLLAFYALSHDITFGGHLLIRVHRLYRILGSLKETFRASGRFIWPLHYLLLLWGVWGISRVSSQRRQVLATALLAAAVVVQAADFNMNPYWFSTKDVSQVPVEGFALTKGHFDHLALIPPEIGSSCGLETDENLVYRYELLALRLGLTYNSGSFARTAQRRVDAQCDSLYESVGDGNLDARTVYVVAPRDIDLFKAAGAPCNRFDGDWVCVSRQADIGFRTMIETGHAPAGR